MAMARSKLVTRGGVLLLMHVLIADDRSSSDGQFGGRMLGYKWSLTLGGFSSRWALTAAARFWMRCSV